jgi:hypothetical protein
MEEKKFLFVIHGESFRLGNAMTRGRGGGDSHRRQQIATTSQLDFLKHIETKFNMKGDIILNSYKFQSDWDTDLVNWYSSSLIHSHFHNELMDSEMHFVKTNITIVKDFLGEKIQDYAFIFYIRVDLYVKQFVFQNFYPYTDRVIFGCLDINLFKNKEVYNNMPGVSHVMFCVPKEFYSLLFEFKFYGVNLIDSPHKIGNELRNYVSHEKITFLSNTFHWLSSDFSWNPIFTMVGRNEIMTPIYDNDAERKLEQIRYINGEIENSEVFFAEEFIQDSFTKKLES